MTVRDGLNNHQRAQLWLRRWDRTLVGKAVVNSDFTFRSVNQQFCKILGVTAAELVGMPFPDITPEPIKSLDVANSQLVIEGIQDHYTLPKIYQTSRVAPYTYAILMVEGIYHQDGSFDCFQTEILQISESEYNAMIKDLIRMHAPPEYSLIFRPRVGVLDFLNRYWKVITTVVGMAAWVVWEMTKLAAAEGKSIAQTIAQLFH